MLFVGDEANHGGNRMSALANSPATPTSAALERHFAPDQIGEMWGLSADSIRRIFEREPGVLVLDLSKGRRNYRTLRVPESVMQRVHRRMSNSALTR